MTATNPTTLVPEHDITLTAPDGGILHYILADSMGKRVKDSEIFRALGRTGLSRTALQTSATGTAYSDMVLPYQSIEQDDWAGGRGSNDFQKDTTRYYDAYRVLPAGGGLVLGGVETQSTGMLDFNIASASPISLSPYSFINTDQYLAVSFVPAATYTLKYVQVYLDFIGAPASPLYCAVYNNSGGSPSTIAGASALDSVEYGDVPDTRSFVFELATPQSVTSGTTYWLVFYVAVAGTATNCWHLKCTTGLTSKDSGDGTTWTAEASDPWFIAYPDGPADKAFFFEYKGAEYLVHVPDSGLNSFLWINGDRGVADSNSGDKTKLNDASKTLVANRYAGCYAYIFAGPGSEEAQPWRLITANTTGGVYTVSSAWIKTHTTDTQYVILGSNHWTSLLDLGGSVTDVAVAGDFIYFARGDSGSLNVLRYMWGNNYGVEQTSSDTEFVKARNLVAIRHPENDEYTVYGSLHTHDIYGVCVWKGSVPPRWGSLYRDMGTLLTNNQPFDESLGANITTVMDEGAMKITIAAAAGVGVICSKALPAALDITAATHIAILVKSDVANDGNDIQISRSSTAILGDTEKDVNMGFWYANVPQWCTTAITPAYSATTGSNDKAIISFGFKLVNDQGAQNIWIYGPIKLMTAVLTYIDLPNDMRINRLVAYSGNQTDPRENPWIITEGQVYEIQTQNGNVVVPIPIKEMATFKSYQTGQAAAVNDVYLYFNILQRIERYFGRNLDDIGPDRDEGLPTNRRGDIVFILSYPGRVIVGIDAGTSGYSGIYMLNGSSWDELYRSTLGNRIRGGGLQSQVNSSIGRLWFYTDTGPVWIPLATDPLNDDNFLHTHYGYLESPWIYTNLKAILKVWKSITLILNDMSVSSGTRVYIDYKVDEDTDGWTTISTSSGVPIAFDDTIREENNFSSATLPNVRGYRIKYRMRFYSYNDAYSPNVIASVIDTYGIVPIKHAYNFTSMIAEDYLQKKLGDGGDDLALGTYDRVETALALMDTWASTGTPLTLNTRVSWIDSLTVIMQDVQASPLSVNSAAQQESALIQVTLHDI